MEASAGDGTVDAGCDVDAALLGMPLVDGLAISGQDKLREHVTVAVVVGEVTDFTACIVGYRAAVACMDDLPCRVAPQVPQGEAFAYELGLTMPGRCGNHQAAYLAFLDQHKRTGDRPVELLYLVGGGGVGDVGEQVVPCPADLSLFE